MKEGFLAVLDADGVNASDVGGDADRRAAVRGMSMAAIMVEDEDL